MHLRSLAAGGFLTGCLAAGLAFPLQVAAAEPVGRVRALEQRGRRLKNSSARAVPR